MQVTLTTTGVTNLSTAQTNRERFKLASYALYYTATDYSLTVSNYSTTQLAAVGTMVDSGQVSTVSSSGDTVTITIELPDDGNTYTFNQLELLDESGDVVALASFASISKTGILYITGTLYYTGLGTQITYASSALTLSRTATDLDDIMTQFQSLFLNNVNWSALITTETGNALLEAIAASAELGQYSAITAYQEGFFRTAQLNSSIYAKSIDLGVRLTRKSPASCTVTLTRDDTTDELAISTYTQFSANGTSLFNRSVITFAAGVETVTATLYQGRVVSYSYTGDGTDFQTLITREDEFYVSNTDIAVTVASKVITLTSRGLWHYSTNSSSTKYANEFTAKTGEAVVRFGKGIWGCVPGNGDTIVLTYVVTTGASGNDTSFTDTAFTYTTSDSTSISCTATTALSNGSDELDVTVYRDNSPELHSADSAAVTPSEYTSLARSYPGVVDARVFGQRDLAGNDVAWFNVVKVILLTSTTWTTTAVSDFVTWMEERCIYSTRFQVYAGLLTTDEPKQRTVNVNLSVYCFAQSDLATVKTAVKNAITAFFQVRAGILSYDVFRSDLSKVARAAASTQIDYVVLNSPTVDIGMDLTAPVISSYSDDTSTGTLPSAYHMYLMTSYDSSGESTPSVQSWSAKTSGAITIVTQYVPAATGYRFYGRVGDAYGLMADSATDTTAIVVSGGLVTFIDDGSLTPNTAVVPPSINTSGVHYPVLGTLTVNMYYSKRP